MKDKSMLGLYIFFYNIIIYLLILEIKLLKLYKMEEVIWMY